MVDNPSTYIWRIQKFFLRKTMGHSSDLFSIDGYNWQLQILPMEKDAKHLTVHLCSIDAATKFSNIYAEFSLAVINQINNDETVKQETEFRFNHQSPSKEFTTLVPLSESRSQEFVVSDTLVIKLELFVPVFPFKLDYNKKLATGFLGLRKQGTCYMNSVLQILFHIPYFRKAVYEIQTTNGIALALQRIFYKLQNGFDTVETEELGKYFGSDTLMEHDVPELRVLLQHDVQELNRVLREIYEEKMHMGELQLDVRGCRDVYESLAKYVKQSLFVDFPPVLQLLLKRFDYDCLRGMVKLNDRYTFPLRLDLDRENGKYLSPEADRNVQNLYSLHSVLVHSGGVQGGHCYAVIRPTLSDQWLKFDDERISEEQFGGDEEVMTMQHMLVYIRESDKEKIMCDVNEKEIAEYHRMKLNKECEEEEQKIKQKEVAHRFIITKVARSENLGKRYGPYIHGDLVDFDTVPQFRVRKHMEFNDFKEEVAKKFDIPVQYQRHWLWRERENGSYRPYKPLTPQHEHLSVGRLSEGSDGQSEELRLFLEVELDEVGRPIYLPEKTEEDILLFFKHYDPIRKSIRFVGNRIVRSTSMPSEMLAELHQMIGIGFGEDIELYEEVTFKTSVTCKYIPQEDTFQNSELGDGAIIVLQKSPTLEEQLNWQFDDVPSFLEHLHNLQMVNFLPLENLDLRSFTLQLKKNMTYDEVIGRVAGDLGVDDPTKIRLSQQDCNYKQPNPRPIKYRGVANLLAMFQNYRPYYQVLYYEVLDIPLPEFENLKTLEVAFHHATKAEVIIHSIRLPKQSTVMAVIRDLKTKVEVLSLPNTKLRLIGIFQHKIQKIFPLGELIENIDDQRLALRAEEIREERSIGPHELLIHVSHFKMKSFRDQMVVLNFGDPFFFIIHDGKTLSEIKTHLQKKLQVSDEEFSKWKFAFFSSNCQPKYLQDSDILSDHFLNEYGGWEQYLGLEHESMGARK